MRSSKKTRSPLKSRPLRNPGQSLDDQINELSGDLFVPLGFAVFVVCMAGFEWLRYFQPIAPSPWVYSAAAVAATSFAGYRARTTWTRLRALKLGRDGEKAVGQFLECLRENGYRVFHDVVGGSFNVDHVLIGPAGIFTIETKTHSKPIRGKATVVFDGDQIEVNGSAPDRDPVTQAKAQAGWLRQLLTESTGRKFHVTAVISYPGWFVEDKTSRECGVWVIEPKMLPGLLENKPSRLSSEDIHLASFHLSRFIRTAESGFRGVEFSKTAPVHPREC